MNKYNEAMARVAVSEETKNRILNEIGKENVGRPKVVRLKNAKRYIALAASFAFVLIGVLIVALMNRQPNTGVDLTGGPAVEYQSAKELRKASGVKIEDLQNLPFEPTETRYLDYQCNLVEIAYSDETQSLYYRVSKGRGDNSGDYNEYETVETKNTGGVTVTLKGSGELIYCALYEKGGRSYSVVSTAGLTWEQLEAMIS